MNIKVLAAILWFPAIIVVCLVYIVGWVATLQTLGLMAGATIVGLAWAGGIEYARKPR